MSLQTRMIPCCHHGRLWYRALCPPHEGRCVAGCSCSAGGEWSRCVRSMGGAHQCWWRNSHRQWAARASMTTSIQWWSNESGATSVFTRRYSPLSPTIRLCIGGRAVPLLTPACSHQLFNAMGTVEIADSDEAPSLFRMMVVPGGTVQPAWRVRVL